MSHGPHEKPTEQVFPGYSEFGAALADFVEAEASAHGAILSDNEGDPVDFSYRHGAVTPLDLQIAGAQVEQAATRMAAWCVQQGLGRCEILIEASHGLLLSAMPGRGCVLTSLHSSPDPDPAPEQPAPRANAADPGPVTQPTANADGDPGTADAAARDHAAAARSGVDSGRGNGASSGADSRPDGRDALLARFAALRHRIARLIQ